MSRKRARTKEVASCSFREFLIGERRKVETENVALEKLRESLKSASGDSLRDLRAKLTLQACETQSLAEFDEAAEPYIHLLQTKEATDAQVLEMYKREVLRREFDVQTIDMETCSFCGVDLVQGSESCALFCPQCGRSIQFLDATTGAAAFGEDSEGTSCSYKRINHLKEWIAHFQAKDAPVPEEVLEQVMRILRDKGFTCASDILMRDVRRALKDLGQKRFFDHTMSIWITLTGLKPIRFDPVFLEKVHLMFKRVQAPFAKWFKKFSL